MLRKLLRLIMGTPAVLPETGKPIKTTPQKMALKERELIRKEAQVAQRYLVLFRQGTIVNSSV